jgi:anaerobic magnesium-protoporphyrin IX monomethyl ester cyclase
MDQVYTGTGAWTDRGGVITRRPDKPNVLLCYPKTGMDFGSTVAPPHALLTIAAPIMQAGYSVTVLDQRDQPITMAGLRALISSDLLCVGISAMTGTQVRNAIEIAAMVRRLTGGSVPIVWGGPHPSVVADQTLDDEHVDIVVVGEGEVPFLNLVKALDAKTPLKDVPGIRFKDGTKHVFTGEPPLLDVEDLLPVPWELVNVERYVHRDMYLRDKTRVLDLGQSSRGCPFDCGFCSSAEIRQRKWRAMSVEKTLEMMERDVRRFKLDGFWLRDDEFYIKRKRAHAIFEGMLSRGLNVGFYTSGTRVDVFNKATPEEIKLMKRAGAHTLKFGAESGSQRILDLMQKGITVEQTIEANRKCAEFGISPAFALMIGYPTETFDEMNMTIDLAFRLRRENPRAQTETIAQYTALPGTPDFKMAQFYGLKAPKTLREWADWLFDDYDFEGRRSPWFAAKERVWMGNISYMSILSNALENVGGTQGNWLMRKLRKAGSVVVGCIYRWKLKHKMYRFAPELGLVRYLRHRLFYGKGENPFTTWAKYIGIHLDEHEQRQTFQAKGWNR